MQKLVYSIIILFYVSLSFSQNKEIDSLKNIASQVKEDTLKVKALNDLSWLYKRNNLYDSSMQFAIQASLIAKKINDKKGLALAYNNKGLACFYTSKYAEALKNYDSALLIRKQLNDLKGIAYSYGNMGNVFRAMGKYADAIKRQLTCLEYLEKLGDKRGIALAFNNIGNVYYLQHNYSQSLDAYTKSLQVSSEVKDKRTEAGLYCNIAEIYRNQKKLDEALAFQQKALGMSQELNDKEELSNVYSDIALIYYDKGNYEEALKNHFIALKLKEETEDMSGIAWSYTSISEALFEQKKYAQAEEYGLKALKLSEEINELDNLQEANLILSQIYGATGKDKKALEHYKQYITCRDSMLNEENTKKTVQAQMQYEFDKKQTADSLQVAEERKINVAKFKQERTQRYALYGGLVLVALFAGFMFNRFKITHKQKLLIEQKEKETHQQKELIEEKQKEILDSIHYAKRIQRAMITSDAYISQFLNDYFIFYQPKDIVSGDFYWALHTNNSFYLVVADCTGHGVPGAFMSLLNISMLNEVMIEKKITRPDLILNEARKDLIKALNPKGSEESKDGMDCALACFDFTHLKLQYAAANNSFYIVRNNELILCKADKMPVGKSPTEEQPFTFHEISLQKNDVVYLFSDGLADQFGGPKGKKFKYKQLEDILLANVHKPMNEQKLILESIFKNWKGSLEQVDDILLIGVRV